MLRATLLAILLATLPPFSTPTTQANPPASEHHGPLSESEAVFLWKKGREAFGLGRYPEAGEKLQRLVDRYPAREGYLEAHLLLGLTYLRMKEPQKALTPLRHFASAKSPGTEKMRAKLALGQAYLRLRKFHEALLLTLEILGEKPSTEIRLSALLLKAWSHLGLDQESRAKRALASFQKYKSPPHPDLASEALRLALEIKLRGCGAFDEKTIPDEGVARQKIKNSGICLAEALVGFYEHLKTFDNEWILSSRERLTQGYRELKKDCQNPPAPPGKHNPKKLKRYREELQFILKEDCRQAKARALELTRGWKKKLPASVTYHLNDLEKFLQKL